MYFSAVRNHWAKNLAVVRRLANNALRTERAVAEVRRRLHDDQAFDRAWNEGRSMTLA